MKAAFFEAGENSSVKFQHFAGFIRFDESRDAVLNGSIDERIRAHDEILLTQWESAETAAAENGDE